MNAPIAGRAGADLDVIVAELIAELGAIGLGAAALQLEACASDNDRASGLRNIATMVRCIDRRIHLRSACAFAGRACESLANGDHSESERWRKRAERDLERYRDVPEGSAI